MSNRSVFEFNHDLFHRSKDDPQGFVDALQGYLRCACAETAEPLKRYGLTWFGMRHHSDPWKDHIEESK